MPALHKSVATQTLCQEPHCVVPPLPQTLCDCMAGDVAQHNSTTNAACQHSQATSAAVIAAAPLPKEAPQTSLHAPPARLVTASCCCSNSYCCSQHSNPVVPHSSGCCFLGVQPSITINNLQAISRRRVVHRERHTRVLEQCSVEPLSLKAGQRVSDTAARQLQGWACR